MRRTSCGTRQGRRKGPPISDLCLWRLLAVVLALLLCACSQEVMGPHGRKPMLLSGTERPDRPLAACCAPIPALSSGWNASPCWAMPTTWPPRSRAWNACGQTAAMTACPCCWTPPPAGWRSIPTPCGARPRPCSPWPAPAPWKPSGGWVFWPLPVPVPGTGRPLAQPAPPRFRHGHHVPGLRRPQRR